uniref:Uncharacterized protein n=1 Tax=Siphoviridae sp. ctXX925 TaxID=2826370 RepID=A0A8S5R211_9CAUD|nr:MAG TPA: hypothetical protein [Siphoviridae sp. ctXX925]
MLSRPYVPNRENIKRDGRTSPYAFLHRIAYTEALRGDNYDERVLLFHAPFALIKDACSFIFRIMNGNIQDLIISNEHSCRRRNGKCYWRVAVQIIGINEQFISFREFTTLLIAHINKICNCKVRYYKLNTFINL